MQYRLILPALYPKQRDAIFDPHRFSYTEAGTKTGKTVGSAVWLIDLAWNTGQPGDQFWWIAPVFGQALIGMRVVSAMLPPQFCRPSWSRFTIPLPNGATIAFKSAEKPDNLYGDRVMGAVFDEASRAREQAWWALRTTITATRARVRFIGNPKGKRNWFYRLCQNAKQGLDAEGSYHHLRSIDNPHISPDEVEAARRLLPPHVFKELYEGIAVDDFTGVFRFVAERSKPGSVIDEPPDHPLDLVCGLDIARIKNWTVAVLMERETHRVVAWDRWNTIAWPMQEARLKALLKEWDNPPVWMDATGPGGDTFYSYLRHNSDLDIHGVDFGGGRKQNLIESLAIAFENGDIWIPDDDTFRGEFEVFEYRVSPSGNVVYSAPEGYDDDIVCATALANWGARRGKTETLHVRTATSLRAGTKPLSRRPS